IGNNTDTEPEPEVATESGRQYEGEAKDIYERTIKRQEAWQQQAAAEADADSAELPNTISVDEAVANITTTWPKRAAALIATGQLLNRYRDELPHGEFTPMIEEKLPFGERTAQMLMEIARNDVLTNPQYLAALPPSITTLNTLAHVPEDKLKS